MAQAKKIEDQNAFQAEPSVLDLEPFAALIERVWIIWARQDKAWQMMSALGGALGLIASRTEVRRRARLERHRVMALRDGEDDPALSRADLKALADADAVEAKAIKGQRGAPAIREKAARMRDKVGADVASRGEARRSDLRLAQTVSLDARREGVAEGAVLERARGQTTRRLRTRDGLVMLFESGAFTPKDGRPALEARIEAGRLLTLGLRYRAFHEISQSELKSCLNVAGGEYRASNFWTQGKAAHRRVALANRVRQIEGAVSLRCGPVGLEALRMIAGDGRTVRSLATSSRRRARLTRRLVEALAIVGENLPGGA